MVFTVYKEHWLILKAQQWLRILNKLIFIDGRHLCCPFAFYSEKWLISQWLLFQLSYNPWHLNLGQLTLSCCARPPFTCLFQCWPWTRTIAQKTITKQHWKRERQVSEQCDWSWVSLIQDGMGNGTENCSEDYFSLKQLRSVVHPPPPPFFLIW